jgi:hypothetical protein
MKFAIKKNRNRSPATLAQDLVIALIASLLVRNVRAPRP